MSSEHSQSESLPTPEAAPASPRQVAPPDFSLQGESNRIILGMLDPPKLAGTAAALGEFDVLRVIGMGGMGVVVLARSARHEKPVAIKLLRMELMHEPRAVQRFLVEARHMSKLSHPNILPVLEVAERAETTPYYVMPYLGSGSVAHLMAAGPLDEKTVCRIASQVAAAIAHAHEQGIIHRDLKPANILLDERGDAHVSDFGLVRTVFNDTLLEPGKGHCEGSAAYMSPAVAAGVAEDTRCDIYSLGATMYEMLTERPPYEGRSSDEILAKVRAGPPAPVLSVNPKASERLARVCEDAMARELRDRYARMQDVIIDLQRIARNEEPLGPRGEAPGARLRAHPVLISAIVLAMLIGGIAVWLAIRNRGQAVVQVSTARVERIVTPGPHPQAVQVPAKLLRSANIGHEVFALRFTPDSNSLFAAHREAPEAMAFFDGRSLEPRFWLKDPAFGYPVDISDDSKLLVSPDARGAALVDLVAGSIVKRFSEPVAHGAVAISGDGKYVASYGMRTQPLRQVLSVHDTESEELLAKHEFAADEGAFFMRFIDDEHILTGTRMLGVLNIIHWRSGKVVKRIPAHTSWFAALVLARDRKLALTGGSEGAARLWGLQSGREVVCLIGHAQDVSGVAFLPDGNLLTADAGGNVFAWDGKDGRELWQMRLPVSFVRMDATSDGSRLAIGTGDGQIHLYALPTAAEVAAIAPTDLPQPAVAEEEIGRYLHHRYQAKCLSIAPDGKRAVSGDAGGNIACFEPRTGNVLWSVRRHDGVVTRVQFIRDGEEILSSSADGTVKIISTTDGSEKSTVWSGNASCIACADDTTAAIAVAGHADEFRVIDALSGQTRWSVPSSGVSFDIAFSTDGKLLAHCRDRFAVFIREAATGREVTRFLGHQMWVTGGCFIGGSETIITCSIDATARLWDVRTGTVIRELKHDAAVVGVAVSQDGRRAATVGADFLKLWDLHSGRLLHSFAASKDCVAVQFTPDGAHMLTAGPGAVIRAWRIPPPR